MPDRFGNEDIFITCYIKHYAIITNLTTFVPYANAVRVSCAEYMSFNT